MGADKRIKSPSPASADSATAAKFGEVTYQVIGAAMRVHNELGPGLKEVHYHKALSSALTEAGLSFEDEKPLQVYHGQTQLGLLFIDHFVESAVVVEEKALSHLLTDEEVAQVLTYLAVSDAPLGLLLNFGRRKLEYRRILPPRDRLDWRKRALRYVWTPPEGVKAHPLIRSESAYDAASAGDSEVRF